MDFNLKWQVIAGVELAWKIWGDEQVVYHGGSGDTHLLNPVAARLLRTLQESPSSILELSDEVVGDDLCEEIEQNIRLLNRLCLIEPSL